MISHPLKCFLSKLVCKSNEYTSNSKAVFKIRIVFNTVLLVFAVIWPSNSYTWGFFSHKKINEIAVYTLPPEMIGFYKKNIHLIIENAVLPDKRRYIDPSEAPRHYIDIDHYGDSAIYTMPRNWFKAVEMYSEDTLKSYGIVPWHIIKLKYILTRAFQEKDFDQILRTSIDMGHYVGDCNVPLHTTENYNGQLTGQYGIHGFWESRLPELFFENYDLFTGQAEYIFDVETTVWEHVTRAHLALDSVFSFEKMLTEEFPEDQKFALEQRGTSTVKTYSKKFSQAYHEKLDGMVERQMKRAIRLLGSIWYTCWVDAGQPLLLPVEQVLKKDTLSVPNIPPKFKTREHEG